MLFGLSNTVNDSLFPTLAQSDLVVRLVAMTEPSGKEVVLGAFDRLLDKAALKLDVTFTRDERDEVKRNFIERFGSALEVADMLSFPSIPEAVMKEMETAIEEISPAELAGYLAAAPLAHQVQRIARQIAVQTAEQRLLEHYLSQADEQYGGN
jgi:hypothetical protein